MAAPITPRESQPSPAAAPRAGLEATLAKELADHPARERLTALAYEVLSRQAEGRLLFSGKEYVERQAAERGVVRDDASTSAGNLLTILERGAENEAERSFIAVAAAAGFSDAVAAAEAETKAKLVTRFVRHVDFLELSTSMSLWSVLDVALDDSVRTLVHRELAQRIVDDGSGERGRAHAMRARNAARLSALAASTAPSARTALEDVIATRAVDAATKRLAESLLPADARVSGPGPQSLSGRLVRPRASAFVRGAALLTGLALLGWALRGLLTLVGARREVDLRLVDTGLELEERTRAFGRVLRQTKSALTFAGVRSVSREVRYPRLHLYVGAIALALGVLVGGTWIFDGVRGGDYGLASLGAGLVLLGAALDLFLDVLVPAQRGRVTVEVAAERGRRVRVGDLVLADADAFVGALRQRMK